MHKMHNFEIAKKFPQAYEILKDEEFLDEVFEQVTQLQNQILPPPMTEITDQLLDELFDQLIVKG